MRQAIAVRLQACLNLGMSTHQPGILAALPAHALYLSFRIIPDTEVAGPLTQLAEISDGESLVVGIGASLCAALKTSIPGLRNLTPHVGPGFSVPSTPSALWCWLRGSDRGELMHRARKLQSMLSDAFESESVIEAFMHKDSRDLSGYVDGTENPEGESATQAAFVSGAGEGLDGSSLVAVQKWVHNFEQLEAMPQTEQDHVIGRRRSDNVELEDAPASAHVKRTAQESFEPEAFVLRRSMPWSQGTDAGLVFVAFGKTLDAFDAQLRRMVGLDDGIVDGLFRFTHPVSGSALWCPPMRDGHLDLRALGL